MVSTPQKSHLAPNDPYHNMEKPITRPSEIARSKLNTTEQNASSTQQSQNPAASTAELAQKLEQNQPHIIKNSVTGRNTKSSSNSKRSFLKGKGPLGLILFLLLGGGALFFSGQSLLGPHLSALYTQATDVQFTSYSLRNQRLFSYMLDGGGQIKQTLFTKKFTTFTPYMKSRLNANGIEVGHIDADGNFVSGDLLAGQSRVLRYNGEIITANDFQAKYASDVEFRDAYYKAKRGRVAGFFDDASDFFYRKFGITRNIFDDYRATDNAENDTQAFQDTVTERVRGTDGDINTASYETDDNGTPDDTSDDTTHLVENGSDVSSTDISGDTPESKARALATSVASKVSATGGMVCAALRVANLISITVAVNQLYQATNYFLGLTENVSKMMAGEGDASAIHSFLNFFNTPTTNEVQYTTDSGVETKTVTGTPLESSGAKLVLGGITPNQYEIGAYSIDTITKAATRTVLVNGATTVGCSGIQAASAIISLASSAIPGGSLAKFVLGMLAETFGSIAITGIVSLVVSAIVPIIAQALYTDLFEAYTGIPAGELYTLGAAKANGNLAQTASSYMPASEERLKAQNRATTVAIAQEAEIDRLNRSPLDATSPNTFLGSIYSSLLPLFTNSSIPSRINAIFTTIGSSVQHLLPAASALDETTSYTSYYQPCEGLPGAMCDAYGSPISVTDLSTVDIAPDDPTYESVIMANMEDDGITIKTDSELAKFITFCANRESPWGATDANILDALQTNFGTILNNMPFLSDVVDLVNAAQDTANLGWATGEICINSASNPRWESEFKYYQRYIEDTRILDGMGAYEGDTNPVLAYQEDYYARNPIDTSYEGTLARLTGYTKDDISFMLEFVDYYNYLASYDANEREPFAFNTPNIFEVSPYQTIANQFQHNTTHQPETITYYETIYADTRNRSYAV